MPTRTATVCQGKNPGQPQANCILSTGASRRPGKSPLPPREGWGEGQPALTLPCPVVLLCAIVTLLRFSAPDIVAEPEPSREAS